MIICCGLALCNLHVLYLQPNSPDPNRSPEPDPNPSLTLTQTLA